MDQQKAAAQVNEFAMELEAYVREHMARHTPLAAMIYQLDKRKFELQMIVSGRELEQQARATADIIAAQPGDLNGLKFKVPPPQPPGHASPPNPS